MANIPNQISIIGAKIYQLVWFQIVVMGNKINTYNDWYCVDFRIIGSYSLNAEDRNWGVIIPSASNALPPMMAGTISH
jgi:hypothetical protein